MLFIFFSLVVVFLMIFLLGGLIKKSTIAFKAKKYDLTVSFYLQMFWGFLIFYLILPSSRIFVYFAAR